MTGVWIAAACALLAIVAAGALIAAQTRVAAAVAFALIGASSGVAQMASGSAGPGLALIACTALLTLTAHGAGVLAGEPAPAHRRAPLLARLWTGGLGAAALGALLAAWPLTPAALTAVAAPVAPAFQMNRTEDLLLALAALVGVAAAAAALLGFGERGVIGARP